MYIYIYIYIYVCLVPVHLAKGGVEVEQIVLPRAREHTNALDVGSQLCRNEIPEAILTGEIVGEDCELHAHLVGDVRPDAFISIYRMVERSVVVDLLLRLCAYIYIYICGYIYICVCVCVYIYVRTCTML